MLVLVLVPAVVLVLALALLLALVLMVLALAQVMSARDSDGVVDGHVCSLADLYVELNEFI